MTIEKLPSGSYRIREMRNGKNYSVTVPTKPNKREAEEIIRRRVGVPLSTESLTFGQACTEYIEMKRNVLSPSTIKGYTMVLKHLPEWFTKTNVNNLDDRLIQRCVNEMAVNVSPKTISNRYGLISAVVGAFRQGLVLNVTLPQKIKTDPYIPTPEEVKTILEYVKEDSPKFYIPIALAASCGLRRSEILALKAENVQDGMLVIDSATVLNDRNEWVNKTTKTVESTRRVPVSPELAQMIIDKGYAYKGDAISIYKYLLRVEAKFGISEFSLHKLRHFYASVLISHGVPMKDVAALGGWNNLQTLEKIYAHVMKTRTDEQKINVSSRLWSEIL